MKCNELPEWCVYIAEEDPKLGLTILKFLNDNWKNNFSKRDRE